MPFSRSGRRISMEQYERDEDVWPPRLPAKSEVELRALAEADRRRAHAEANERALMDADDAAFEHEFDVAQREQGAIDVKEYATTESLLEQLHRKDP